MDFKFCSILAAGEGEPVDGTAPEKDGIVFLPAQKPFWHEIPVKEKLLELSIDCDFSKTISSFDHPLFVYYSPDEMTGNNIFVSDSIRIKCFSENGLMIESSIKKIYAICTDGVKDACCAKFGIPIAKAFMDASKEDHFSISLETSHIGGCRFAATAICFPSGNSYGRILPGDVGDIKLFEEKDLIVSKIFRGNVFVSELHCWIMRHCMERFGFVPTTEQTVIVEDGNNFHVTIKVEQGFEVKFELHRIDNQFKLFSGCSNINSERMITRTIYNFV